MKVRRRDTGVGTPYDPTIFTSDARLQHARRSGWRLRLASEVAF